jgi:hypothetical protein
LDKTITVLILGSFFYLLGKFMLRSLQKMPISGLWGVC